MRYHGNAYWETETPQEIRTDKVWLTYFPEAGRCQIATLWQNQDGPQRGKTVTLAVEDLAAHPEACAVLRQFLTTVEDQGEVSHGRS